MANEAALADHLRTTVGALYYVSYGEGGPIKIGFVSSIGALSERLRGLQTACPFDLILLAVRQGAVSDERGLHERFAAKRMRGEWFTRHKELMRHINGVRRRKDCRAWLPLHEKHLPPPSGFTKLRCGRKTYLVSKNDRVASQQRKQRSHRGTLASQSASHSGAAQ